MAKNQKKNQRERVLEWLKKYGSINDNEARDELGIRRCGARIYELRDMNYNIVTKMEVGKNRFGEKVRYGVYYLKEGEEDAGV